MPRGGGRERRLPSSSSLDGSSFSGSLEDGALHLGLAEEERVSCRQFGLSLIVRRLTEVDVVKSGSPYPRPTFPDLIWLKTLSQRMENLSKEFFSAWKNEKEKIKLLGRAEFKIFVECLFS